VLLGALLGACAHAPIRPGAPTGTGTAPTGTRAPPTVLPQAVPDLGTIGDAVPRAEPRSASGNPPFYEIAGHRYIVLASERGYVERGVASWYGTEFHGLRTSTGEPYDMFAMTAAHKTLPLPCYARVTNLENGRSVVVRINDRGPFVANRIIDLSYTAASKLDMIRNGTAFVQVEALTAGAPAVQATLPVTTSAASEANVGLSTVPAVPTRFYIQVGAYARAENAQHVLQTLRAAGLDASSSVRVGNPPPLQRVRIGPISSVQEFDALSARLAALGFPDARLAQE
jgi:rare lipoprotein A